MGYSFEHVDLPEPAANARTHAEECLDLGGSCGSWPRCRDDYHSLAADHQFHLNIAGMGFCRELMRRAGMTYQATPRPFPDWPFDSVDDWRDADQSRRDAYKEAERAAAAQTEPGMVGIPEFKFTSNGPWLVGPTEIEQALIFYEASPADLRAECEADELWVAWLGWLREARAHGGFTVS
ncbi:hypothetical protein ABZS77_15640 [Micromonospora sp. NPDC005298]|uniref:hypothetical protein n=1 Tax=Micromonospora sp. NPDC005298 TaxID=3156873 RepID=UPI0033AA94E5